MTKRAAATFVFCPGSGGTGLVVAVPTMPPTLRLAACLLALATTLAFAMARPGREAQSTCLGAAGLLALRLVTPRDVVDILEVTKAPLLFLLALLILSALLEVGGFFEWAAVQAARRARGDGPALYRNTFLLGVAITAFLSLDTTAVILTPLVFAFARRLRIPTRPYVFACAFVANTASLALPVSNLTNLLFAGTFHLTAARFAATMALPQLAALAATFGICRRLFRAELPSTFEPDLLPSPASVIPDRAYFRAAFVALGVACAGYFLAPLVRVEPYVPAFAVSLVLLLYGRARDWLRPIQLVHRVNWSVFPFVIGLFVVVRGVENAGLAGWVARGLLALSGRPWAQCAAFVGVCAGASNLMNNLPAAVLGRGVLLSLHAPSLLVYGALLGTNVGPNIVPFGSLATMLVLGRARREAVAVKGVDFVRVGIVVTIPALAVAGAALAFVTGGSR